MRMVRMFDRTATTTRELREMLIDVKGLKGEDKAFALSQPRSVVLGMLLGWSYERMVDHYNEHYQENLLSDTNEVMQ